MKPQGLIRIYDVDKTGSWLPLFEVHNQIQKPWGFMAAKLFGEGDSKYKVAGMYLEFENVADPSDPVSIPEFSRDEGLEYYDNLSGDRDYLRLNLLGVPSIEIAPGFESIFEKGVSGNRLTFFAQSSGVAGAHGVEFSADVNSKAVGVALVAVPGVLDRTQDVIFARGYFDVSDQIVKGASKQIGVGWQEDFK